MTENKDKITDKDKDKDKDKRNEVELEKEQQPIQKEQQDSKRKRLSQFLDMLNIPRYHSGHSGSSSSNTSQQHSPQTPHAATLTMAASLTAAATTAAAPITHTNGQLTPGERIFSPLGLDIGGLGNNLMDNNAQQQQQQHQHYEYKHQSSRKRSSCFSFCSEICLLDLFNGELLNEGYERSQAHKDDYGTQRVYKKTSPNCVLTLYLPTREIILSGNSPSELRGIVFVDPKALQGYRVYAQLTLTFRYGREDEEVMGLRFCNEAVMSLQQLWPKNEDINNKSLSPLQEALVKRLGDGAHPFILTLTTQAPPSVQLVPAKRYYGAPIGTSYDVRCFIADKTDEKFHRRASVKMGVRVLYRTDVFNLGTYGSEKFSALINNPITSPPVTVAGTNTKTTVKPTSCLHTTEALTTNTATIEQKQPAKEETQVANKTANATETRPSGKPHKSERGDSFPKLRLSPKPFRFSGRFGRSKSEVEKCNNDSFNSYSKSFQEYDSVVTCGGPQGAVDKPFLLQDGRVGLKASLDKAWYTHGEEVRVTINIKNDSRKTVRKIRVCAIQHVDVCMFNNGKFKNVVADSDNLSPSPVDQHVAPGCTLNTTVILKPQRGPTKNWIALEDTLQKSTEPEEITATIAASAVRTPHFLMQFNQSPNNCTSPAVFVPALAMPDQNNTTNDERNVFAIYVSYYVKVKLTLTGMGGELSLKLPFMLVHVDEEQKRLHENFKLNLNEVTENRKACSKYTKMPLNKIISTHDFTSTHNLDRIESMDEGGAPMKNAAIIKKVATSEYEEQPGSSSQAVNSRRRPFKRCETHDLQIETEDSADNLEVAKNKTEQQLQVVAQVHTISATESKENITPACTSRRGSKKGKPNQAFDDIQQLPEQIQSKEGSDRQESSAITTNVV